MAMFWTVLYNVTCVGITAVSVALAVVITVNAVESVIRAGKNNEK